MSFLPMALVDVNDGASIELVKGELHPPHAASKRFLILFFRSQRRTQHVELARPFPPQVKR